MSAIITGSRVYYAGWNCVAVECRKKKRRLFSFSCELGGGEGEGEAALVSILRCRAEMAAGVQRRGATFLMDAQ